MDTQEFTIRHNGKTHSVEVERRHKGRIMRITPEGGGATTLAGLSKFEDPARAALYVVGRYEGPD